MIHTNMFKIILHRIFYSQKYFVSSLSEFILLLYMPIHGRIPKNRSIRFRKSSMFMSYSSAIHFSQLGWRYAKVFEILLSQELIWQPQLLQYSSNLFTLLKRLLLSYFHHSAIITHSLKYIFITSFSLPEDIRMKYQTLCNLYSSIVSKALITDSESRISARIPFFLHPNLQ